MKNVVRRIADRFVDTAAPHADAKAQVCYWTENYCYCRSGTLYYRKCCVGFGCYCAPRYRAPGGCA